VTTGQRLSLPLPLRKNGIINATDTELELAQGFCEHVAIASTGLVFIGLVLEVYIAIKHPSFESCLGRWGSVAADILVAFGVLGELLPSMLVRRYNTEVKRRSDARLSEAVRLASNANERAAALENEAAQAKLELAKLQLRVAPRILTQEQRAVLQTLRGQVSDVILVWQAESEPGSFAYQIWEALVHAGIEVASFGPRVGLFWAGIYINLPASNVPNSEHPLSKAFIKAGLYSGNDLGMPALLGLPTDIPVVMVGARRIIWSEWSGKDPSDPKQDAE
jgi:hypothetical protein